MKIVFNSRARKGEKERGEVKGEYEIIWEEEEEGNADYRGIMQRGWVGNGHEIFENVDSLFGRHPTVSSVNTVEVTKKAGLVPRRRRAAIGTPFQSPHTIRKETMGVF